MRKNRSYRTCTRNARTGSRAISFLEEAICEGELFKKPVGATRVGSLAFDIKTEKKLER